MIKYIGSKRALIPWIVKTVSRIDQVTPLRRVVDLFSGSARVGHALKAQGFYVIANDHNAYAHVLAQALIGADARAYPRSKIQPVLERLAALKPKAGWFTQTYCVKARYFQPRNGARIEAIREAIEEYRADPTLRAILLTSLLLAADKVDSTTGVQMAYLKRWAPRAWNELQLAYPPLLPGPGEAHLSDALEAAGALEGDLFYLDPPYNSHSYLGNYHVWETLVRFDSPTTYGVAQKRSDVRERKSPFNSKKEARFALERLLARIKAPHLVLSFSDEGFFRPEEIEALLGGWGFVVRLCRTHRRYVGARIGIYNPQGVKVGRVSHTQNREFLFVASQKRAVASALAEEEPTAKLAPGR
ncbi:MAG: DNA adenine methylase [Meiothermus sp.]|uniref:DNA adenine methylase n=1 Tax=Meiothermus sp. TaxID=1955249 RepID=UPI0025EFECDB|nr:DNA adenine methylase [Meiothermus sp.]MCS7193342.1 DNA adenine methylase [Meiothermus sp.]MDW8091509.1 DNA adenine methylase [Meiothermus sp.]